MLHGLREYSYWKIHHSSTSSSSWRCEYIVTLFPHNKCSHACLVLQQTFQIPSHINLRLSQRSISPPNAEADCGAEDFPVDGRNVRALDGGWKWLWSCCGGWRGDGSVWQPSLGDLLGFAAPMHGHLPPPQLGEKSSCGLGFDRVLSLSPIGGGLANFEILIFAAAKVGSKTKWRKSVRSEASVCAFSGEWWSWVTTLMDGGCATLLFLRGLLNRQNTCLISICVSPHI